MDDGEIRSGNVGAVERRGGTLRRPVGRWTPTVHALLRHLELAGFAAAPRVVCVEADVEVLTYIEGEVPGEPWPVALRTDATLTEIGRVLRAFHDAVATFAPPPGSEWRLGTVSLVDDDVVRHGDVGPWNTVWRAGHLVGLIDWDFAVPGPAIADLAQAAIGFVPLARDAVWRRAGFPHPPDRRHRLAVLCEEPTEPIHSPLSTQRSVSGVPRRISYATSEDEVSSHMPRSMLEVPSKPCASQVNGLSATATSSSEVGRRRSSSRRGRLMCWPPGSSRSHRVVLRVRHPRPPVSARAPGPRRVSESQEGRRRSPARGSACGQETVGRILTDEGRRARWKRLAHGTPVFGNCCLAI